MDEIIFSRAYPSMQSFPQLNQPKREKDRNPYDGLRFWSALTHGLGVLLSILGTALLLTHCYNQNGSVWHYVTFSVYGTALIELYAASTLYHSVNTTVKGRLALKKMDHVSIYFLIAGTYTPVCLVPLRGALGWTLFGTIWGLAVLGAVVSLVWIHAPRWVTAGIYLFMGWLAIFAVYPLSRVLTSQGLFWLLLGGVLYTVGGVMYAMKWPCRSNRKFGCHEIFHVFIVLGSICHFLLMYRVVTFL